MIISTPLVFEHNGNWKLSQGLTALALPYLIGDFQNTPKERLMYSHMYKLIPFSVC